MIVVQILVGLLISLVLIAAICIPSYFIGYGTLYLLDRRMWSWTFSKDGTADWADHCMLAVTGFGVMALLWCLLAVSYGLGKAVLLGVGF